MPVWAIPAALIEGIDPAVLPLDRRDKRERLVPVGEIGDVRGGAGAVRPQLGGPLLHPVGGGGDRHGRAQAGEQPGAGMSDAGLAAAPVTSATRPVKSKGLLAHAPHVSRE